MTRTDDLLAEIKDQLVALQRQVSSLTEWQEYVRQNQRTRQRILLPVIALAVVFLLYYSFVLH